MRTWPRRIAGLLATLLMLGVAMHRSEDLAPLLSTPAPDATSIRSGQGTVIAWNPLTGANTIDWRGTLLHDLPIVASNDEVAMIAPGDVVALHITSSGGLSTVSVVGRITRPGTPNAASSLRLRTQSAPVTNNEATLSTSYVDLGTLGPSVTVTIGPTGRALVMLSTQILFAIGFSGNSLGGGLMSFRVTGSGGTVLAEDDSRAVRGQISDGTAAGTQMFLGLSYATVVSSLAPGSYTFTAKYRSLSAAAGCSFDDRVITVIPL